MAVPEGPTDKRYTGNGVTKIFTIPFLLLAATDLDVYIDGIEISSGFAISWFTNLPTGATIVAVLVLFWLVARAIRSLQKSSNIEKLRKNNI